jgi:L-lactate dehydrogenase complex protein LldG
MKNTTFIDHISSCLGRSGVPSCPSPLVRPNTIEQNYLGEASADKVRAMFIKNAEAVGTAVLQCTAAALNETILTAIAQLASGPILLADNPLWQEQQTIAALERVHATVRLWNTGQSRESNLEFAEAAAVGIAVADLALAETGTVMVFSHKGCGRSVTLLPRTTIFVIRRQDIHRRLTQAMEYLGTQIAMGLPSSINFITAASSTADIELVRVQGVHGPVKIAYIVID